VRLDLLKCLWSCVSIVKVICLNVVYKILINRLMAVSFVGILPLVRRDVVGLECFAQHDVSSLRWNVVHSRPLHVFKVNLACDCVVRRIVLQSISPCSN